jgi:hypothetical protein
MSSSTFSENISTFIDGQVAIFISQVADRFHIVPEDLTDMWEGRWKKQSTQTTTPLDKDTYKKTPKETTQPPAINKEKVDTSSTPGNICQHVWTKGDRKGTICGCIVKNPTKKYCTKHIKQNSEGNATKVKTIKDARSTKTKVLRRNKTIDRLWHEDSGMVFESIDDRRIIGKYHDGAIVPLSIQDIDICKELGFIIKPGDAIEEDKKEEETEIKTDRINDTINEVEQLLGSMTTTDRDDSDEELLEEEE